jgi:hypothetical protein
MGVINFGFERYYTDLMIAINEALGDIQSLKQILLKRTAEKLGKIDIYSDISN